MPKLTDDELRAIRARDEAYAHAYKIWNSQRNPDSDFYDDTPIPHPSAPEDRAALLAHADAQDAELARLRGALEKIADLPGQVTDLDGTAYAAGVREAAAIARRALEESNDGRPAD